MGGAVGDALGAPVEFLSRADIQRRFGNEGINALPIPGHRRALITDDTQMTLFTADGLLRAWVRGNLKGISSGVSVTSHAYQRWLLTQGEMCRNELVFGMEEPGWLFGHRELHNRRAPGLTCLEALRTMPALGAASSNDSKGCGGVMRVAPVGLFRWRRDGLSGVDLAFQEASELAALTHGHKTGSLTAGVLAAVLVHLLAGRSLPEAIQASKTTLRTHQGHEETLAAIELAQTLAGSEKPSAQAIEILGHGWVAEEALSIALYCALVASDFRSGAVLAVNHDGDSDSTGAIAGNLLGLMYGEAAIPPDWLAVLELRDVIAEVAEDLCCFMDWNLDDNDTASDVQRYWRKYPGY